MAVRDGGHLVRTLNLEAKKRRVAELRVSSEPEAASALVELLRDDSWFVRDLASAAVVERGRSLGGAVLSVMMSGLWYSRAAAALVLGRIGAVEVAPAVAALLHDGNRTVREAGYDALILLASAGGEHAVALGVRTLETGLRARFLDEARVRHPAIASRIAESYADTSRERDRGELALEPVRT